MAAFATSIDPLAALPCPGDYFEVALGPYSVEVATARYTMRQFVCSELVTRSKYWTDLLESEFALAADADAPPIEVTYLSGPVVASIRESIDFGTRIRPVRPPRLDD